ncbi:glutamine amidotransferase [Caldimicrobium thiodismutans]|uniref:Glutamine amidotransferase n=1 Tax=Caldimicrobium thiodismutans TaxID=1653476 RepID=A0A0U5ATA2_9BACT|nr:type 1 glutamine amidotransferase [Caldimicrobium thiodismutans]BAU22504.1 glutamine amidotransferase [Caldimicrobium thiodismutans]
MKILAIRHVEIEHLSAFEGILKNLGIEWTYLDTPKGERLFQPLEEYMALFVLGGYMGAYEEDKYDFLAYEFKLMEAALKRDIPVLGICLGAQMLAKVLGAKVYPGDRGKEIGWMEVIKTGDHPYFSDFPERLKVFQWHGDTFDLPGGAERVFSSEKYENQGFVYGKSVGLQFHLEVDKELALTWKEVYKEEIFREGIDYQVFSAISESEEKLLKQISFNFLKRFLGGI